MGNNRYRLCDVEEAAEKMGLMDAVDDLVETEEGLQLVISGWHVRVESLGLDLRQGIVCIWDEAAGMFLPESDVTVILEGDPKKQGRLWYVQEGFDDALALWMEGRMEAGLAGQLWCELILPEGSGADERMEKIFRKERDCV